MIFSDYTWVGYFVAASATGYVVLIAMVLKPDVEGDAAARRKDTVSLTEAKTRTASMGKSWADGFLCGKTEPNVAAFSHQAVRLAR